MRSIAAIRVLLVTGARPGEVTPAVISPEFRLGPDGSELHFCDLEARFPTIRVPRAKGDRGAIKRPLGRLIFLPSAAVETIREVPRSDGSIHAFPGDLPGEPIRRLEKAWDHLLETAGLPHIPLKTTRPLLAHSRSRLRHSPRARPAVDGACRSLPRLSPSMAGSRFLRFPERTTPSSASWAGWADRDSTPSRCGRRASAHPRPHRASSSPPTLSCRPGATDPPGTPVRAGYRVSMPLQGGVLGYALFVNPGTVYQFAGLLQANRVNAPDELLLAPTAPGVVRYLYVRAFSATGYGPSSLPVRIP